MGGGTGSKGGYKVGKNEDAEGMCTSVASLEPDPRYEGCCSSIFRPGRLLRDIVVGALVVIAIAVVIAVVFVVCFFFIPSKSGVQAPQPGEESAFHGKPLEAEGPYNGINEVELHNNTRYEVDPKLGKVKEGETDPHGHDHDEHVHDHGHDHENHTHDHEAHGHEEHHHVGPIPESEPEPEAEPEPTGEPEPEPEATPEPEPEGDHSHGKGPVAHDHTHPEADHDHTHPEADHDHTHPAMDHEHAHEHGAETHDHAHPEMDHDQTHPAADHDHAHPAGDHDHAHADHEHAHPAETQEHAQERGPLTHDHTHPEADHDHTHPEADNNHTHPEADHDHTHPEADNNHTHPEADHEHIHPAEGHELTQEHGAETHDHAHPEADHDHAHPEADHNDTHPAEGHDHTHPEEPQEKGPLAHDHTHPEADNNHTHPEADHDHTHPAEGHEHTQEHGPIAHDHTHPEADHDHTHPEADHNHTHPAEDHDHAHPAEGHDHAQEQAHDHARSGIFHEHTNPKMAHDHVHPTDAVHHASEAPESEVTEVPTTHSPSDKEDSSLPPLFELFGHGTTTEEHTEHAPEGNEGTLKELVVPHEHHAEEPHHHGEAHHEEVHGVAVAEATEETPQGECQPRQLEMCSDLPHTLTAFPNWAGDQTEEDMQKTSLPFLRDVIVRSRCSPRAKEYSCAILEPPCTPEGTILPPCRTFCKSVASTCQEFINSRFSLSSAFDCDKFPDSSDPSVCFDMTQAEGVVPEQTGFSPFLRLPAAPHHGPGEEGSPINFPSGPPTPVTEAQAENRATLDRHTASEGDAPLFFPTLTEDYQVDYLEEGVGDQAGSANFAFDYPLEFTESESPASPPHGATGITLNTLPDPGSVAAPPVADTTCRQNEFECADGSACLPSEAVCDGLQHCGDGSDEADCQHVDDVPADNSTTEAAAPEEATETEATLLETTTLAAEAENTTASHCPELQCLDGTCISLSQVNDGVKDCPEGIDEEDFGGLI